MRKVLIILGQLRDEDVDWIARNGRREDAPANRVVIARDTKISDVIFVLDGTVEVSAGGQVLARLQRGEVLGEMSLIENQTASADARTVTPCTLLYVPLAVLRAKLAADTGFAARFYRAIAMFLADRIRTMNEQRGNAAPSLDDLDEIDDDVLDVMHLAGQRFLTVLASVAQ
jgi:CRP-like cAMP-binding protein